MNPRFVALPVGQGDAFFYQQENLSLLVDGGKSISTFSCKFKKYLEEIDMIDVAICTHNDADHTNGIIGLLKDKKVKIKEIWLPGSWSYKLKQLLENEDKLYYELCKNISELNREDINSLEDLELIPEYNKMNVSEENNENFDFLEMCENRKESHSFSSYYSKRIFYKHFVLVNKSKINLLKEAIDAADRIKRIAGLAYDQNVTIKWFCFKEFQKKGLPYGGKKDILEPVNSREIISLKSISNITPLTYLFLSVTNKESLVFIAFQKPDQPTVLFTADSDLNFKIPDLHPKDSIIVTAPHHGSEENKDAYDKIEQWHTSLKEIVWIRSDSNNFKYKKRPGQSFLKVKGNRYCTLCNIESNSKNKQAVIFTNKLSSWIKNTNVSDCNCI